jgi:hypothetical protein
MFLLLACTAPDADSASPLPVLGEQIQVTPGHGMPAEAASMPSNNNLDVVRHEGRVFYAFRTAPDHFASSETRLHVVSSEDQDSWDYETSFYMETDLREPRFLSWEGRLFLYFAVLGTDALAFEPQGTMVSVYEDGTWSDPEWLFQDSLIPWRTRVMNGDPTLIGYTGGDEIYDQDGMPAIEVKWMTSTDGLDWTGPTVWTGGGSETDFAFRDDGSLVAVIRNEAGDAEGFGSLVCSAPSDALTDWTCAHDPKKYDSPLVFEHGGEVWLIGRRNLTDTGDFDLGRDDLGHEEAFLNYSVDYWQNPKRCSLWRVDGDALSVEFVLDLPSRGDTCFASILEVDDKTLEVYNYSSDPSGPDLSWLEGQKGETNIYRQRLTFP